jgi:hypothetical protein
VVTKRKSKPIQVYERPEDKTPHTFKTKKEAKEFVFEILKGPSANDMPDWSDYTLKHAAVLAPKEEDGADLSPERDEQIKQLFGKDGDMLSEAFKSKYSGRENIRFLEAYNKDPILAAATDLLFQFVLGEYPKTIIDTNTTYANDEEEEAALKEFSSDETILRYKKILDQINKECEFTENMVAGLNQAGVFGRDVLLKERDQETRLPIALKVLPAMRLGRQWVHKKKWTLMGVEYQDFKFPDSILKAEDVIHIPMHNYHMSPNTLHFGNSLFERIIDVSDLNRIINQTALKEINFRLWAAFLLVQVEGLNKEAAKTLVKKIAAGKSIITNQATTVQVFQLGHDLEKLVGERIENMRMELNGLQVPELIFRNDVTNRSVSNDVLVSWTQSVLKSYRRWIGALIQRQWIDDILKTLIMNDLRPSIAKQPIAPFQINTSSSTNTNGLPTSNPLPLEPLLDPKLFPPESFDSDGVVIVSKLPWKIKVEPVNYNFEVPSEKAKMSILLKNAGIISKTKALEINEFWDEIEAMKLQEEEKNELKDALIDEQAGVIAEQNTGPGVKAPPMPNMDLKNLEAQELALASASQRVNKLVDAKIALTKQEQKLLEDLELKLDEI